MRRESSSTASTHDDNVSRLLDRAWLLPRPDAEVTETGGFAILRDDLADPIVHGNKLRKLDALWPELLACGCRDVVACGGAQSANLAAIAALAARSRGRVRAHLLIRGERPAIPTGNGLLHGLLAGGSLRYVPRREFADRQAMLEHRAVELQAGGVPTNNIVLLPEGVALPAALLGSVRLVRWLVGQDPTKPTMLVVDCGTGATAAGLALGCALCAPPGWRITGVAVAAGPQELHASAMSLLAAAEVQYNLPSSTAAAALARIDWMERPRRRKFGRILPGDGERVRRIAACTGILLDPLWTLAAWEVAEELAAAQREDAAHRVLMLHTGGMGNLYAAAQRWPHEFSWDEHQ